MRLVLLKPLINEKSMQLTKEGMYTFEVTNRATKEIIKKVIEEKFKVDVLKVATISLPTKTKLQRTRKGYFQVKGSKKAIVKLKNGQKIVLFEVADKGEAEELEPEVKEKKSLLKGTKVRVEKVASDDKQETNKKNKGGEKS